MSDPVKAATHELDLRDLVRVFWKRKIFLIIVVAAALALGIAVSLFVLPKQYVATASVTVSPQPVSPAALVEKVTISEPFSFVKSPTKAEYLNRMNSQEVLQGVIDTLSLPETPDALRSAITLTDVPSSELINITVVYGDPDTAKKIADTLSSAFKAYVSELRVSQLTAAAEFADARIATTQSSYDEQLAELESLEDAHDIGTLAGDITRAKTYLDLCETRRLELDTSINKDAAFVKWIEETYDFANEISPEDYQVILESATRLDVEPAQMDIMVSGDSMSETVVLYRYVSAKMNLLSAATEIRVLNESIPELEAELDALENEYDQYSNQYDMLNRDLIREKSVLLAYDQRKTEIETLISGDTSTSIVNISSEAVASAQPASPSLLKNVLIAAAAGIALGGAIVYFKDFWWNRPVDNP